MKKLVIFPLILFLLLQFIYANDTYFYLAGGNLTPVKESDNLVEMKEETILINLLPKYYEVTVDFLFYNQGETIELEVGFPFFSEGIQGKGEIWDYKCWTNNIETEFKKTPITKEWQKPTGLEYANLRTIQFSKKSETRTRVYYKAKYGASAPSNAIANYLYGTGLSWKGEIGKINLIIENNDINSIFWNVSMNGKSIKNNLIKTKDNRFEIIFENIEPENYNSTFEIELGDVLNDDGPRVFPAYFKFNKKIVVAKSEFKWYTKEQLRLVRNAIYALHGYDFKTEDLKEYFNSVGKNWYPPYEINPNFSETSFSYYEKKNIQNILEEEKKR